jgi:hypothetical protein
MSDVGACPCDGFVHPLVVTNPPGLGSVRYRVGDYDSFREALLRALSGESALAGWHPKEGGDLALQLLEWWAYLADILTFYNERAVQEVFLRTALQPEDVRRIVRLLGYRPRPGIGATGVVAALTDSARPFVLPRGLPIEGPSLSGGAAQIFELDEDVPIGTLGRRLPASARIPDVPGRAGTGIATPRDASGRLIDQLPAAAPVDRTLSISAGSTFKIALGGSIGTVGPGDTLLVLRNDWNGTPYPNVPGDFPALVAGPVNAGTPNPGPVEFALAKVRDVALAFDLNGRPVTEVTALSAHDLDPAALRDDYRILRATKLAHLWLYHARFTGSADPLQLISSGLTTVVERSLDPLGFVFGSGPPPPPPEDPRVLSGNSSDRPAHGTAHLEAVTRGINAGDPVLFEQRLPKPDPVTGAQPPSGIEGMFDAIEKTVAAALAPQGSPTALPTDLANLRAPVTQLVKVSAYSEEIWYANAPQADRIGTGPPVGPPGKSGGGAGGLLSGLTGGLLGGGGGNAEGPIPIPHSKITFAPNPFLDKMAADGIESIVVHYGWQEVGQLVDAPVPPATTTVEVSSHPAIPKALSIPVLVEDATGINGTPGLLGQTGSTTGEPLVSPLRALLNLLPVSRGQTVAPEILGSGDPTVGGQELTLGRAPLTYLADTTPGSTDGYRSTLRIRVDGVEWREVPSFYDQPANARVFVTREDDQQRTHVRFGDGENGARLPAGIDNVVAQYRVGSGAAVPPAGTLTSILRPTPGLSEVANPVPVGGGADPDPPEQIRRYAPRSVLTFGRAISGDDYETVAAQTPGVRRARVVWGWDGPSQRNVVKVFVGDDAAAVDAASAALRAFADPNRPAVVALAAPQYPELTLTVEVDPAYDPDAVSAAVVAALQDPESQPFGSDVVRIGQTVYDSQIYGACLRVSGVTAVRGLTFAVWTQVPRPIPQYLLDLVNFFAMFLLPVSPSLLAVIDPTGILARRIPNTDTYLENVPLTDQSERHAPGEGSFYLLRAASLHVTAERARHGG